MNLFKEPTEKQKENYRKWARDNYEPLTEIKGVWHPVIQEECAIMNKTAEITFNPEPKEDQFNSDAEADADALASAGLGTDEAYGSASEVL